MVRLQTAASSAALTALELCWPPSCNGGVDTFRSSGEPGWEPRSSLPWVCSESQPVWPTVTICRTAWPARPIDGGASESPGRRCSCASVQLMAGTLCHQQSYVVTWKGEKFVVYSASNSEPGKCSILEMKCAWVNSDLINLQTMYAVMDTKIFSLLNCCRTRALCLDLLSEDGSFWLVEFIQPIIQLCTSSKTVCITQSGNAETSEVLTGWSFHLDLLAGLLLHSLQGLCFCFLLLCNP